MIVYMLALVSDVMYGGCVLRAGKTLDQYCIADGCTLHVLRKRKKGICSRLADPPANLSASSASYSAERLISLPTTPEGMSVIFADPRVQEEVGFVERHTTGCKIGTTYLYICIIMFK